MKFAQGAGELQKLPMELDLLKAHAGYYGAETEAKQWEVEKQRKMAEAWAKHGTLAPQAANDDDPMTALIAPLQQVMEVAAAGGDLKTLTETATKIGTLRRQGSQMATEESRQTWYAMGQLEKGLRAGGMLLNGVNDQETLDQAAETYLATVGAPAPWAGETYNPERVAQLRQQALTAAEAARLHQGDVAETNRERERRLAAADRAARRALAEATLRLAQQREARRAKNGSGGAVGAASPEMTSTVQGILAKEAPGLPDPLGASREIAGLAKAWQKRNPGVDFGQAVRKVIEEERTAGNLVTPPGGKPSYGRGTSAADAIPLPADRRTFRTGTVYQTDRGPARYLGGGKFQALPQAPSLLQRTGSFLGMGPSQGPDDDDEED
jgi:hypothetical protein